MSSFDRQMRRRADAVARKEAAAGGGGNRQVRRHAAARGGRLLYHGTTAAMADFIRRDGLRTGRDGRLYLTDSREMAQRYAIWATAMAATVAHPFQPEMTSDIGRRALKIGGDVAVVCHVRVPPSVVIEEEQGSSSPPLPWETTMTGDGTAWFVEEPISTKLIPNYELWRVAELDDDAMIDLVEREGEAIAAAFSRSAIPTTSRPPSAGGDFASAIIEPAQLVDAAIAASPNADSPYHGAAHWRGVAAAGARILELSPADPAVVFAFAILHDSQRHAEGRDPDHGQRAADRAGELTAGQRLTDGQLDVLRAALVDHDQGLTSDDVTIGACWDADRLTLTRLGIEIDPDLLSTTAGRALAATPARLPSEDHCDWPWVVFRYHVAPALRFVGTAQEVAA